MKSDLVKESEPWSEPCAEVGPALPIEGNELEYNPKGTMAELSALRSLLTDLETLYIESWTPEMQERVADILDNSILDNSKEKP